MKRLIAWLDVFILFASLALFIAGVVGGLHREYARGTYDLVLALFFYVVVETKEPRG